MDNVNMGLLMDNLSVFSTGKKEIAINIILKDNYPII